MNLSHHFPFSQNGIMKERGGGGISASFWEENRILNFTGEHLDVEFCLIEQLNHTNR